MTDRPGRRFDPAELAGPDGPRLTDAELAHDLAMARDLELEALADASGPTGDFTDRVMAAIADEPSPRGVAAGPLRRSPIAILTDAWRVAFTPGRPMLLRAQALALILVAAVALGSLGTAAAVGVAGLLAPDASPPPTEQPTAPPTSPSPSPSPEPSVSPSPSPSPTASERPEPSETPESTGGGSGGGTTPRPTATDDDDDPETPDPDDTPEPGETLKPGETPH